jgi:3-oxoadipate enol-lactonase
LSVFRPYFEVDGPEGAPPLVLAGSLGSTLAMWGPQLPRLTERHRVVRFDLRGHGGSAAPDGPYAMSDLGGDVLAVLDALGLARASFCGISIGGMIGLWLAIHAPERVERLVVVSSSAHVPPAEAWSERAWTVLSAGGTDPIADAVVGRWLTPEYASEHPEMRAWLRDMLTSAQPEGYAGCCAAIGAMDLRDGLPGITAPTLVITAPRDESIPPAHGEALAAAIPGARLVGLSDGAHLVSVERADEVTDLIESFLGG